MRILVTAAALMAALPASAQEGWKFAVSPYLWLPGMSTSTETDRGTIDVEASTSDVVAALNFAVMGAGEARNGKWGLILDLIYSDISTSADTPLGVLWSKADVDTKMTAFTAYAAYRIFENEKAAVDLLGGGRFFDLNIDVALEPGLLARRSEDFSANWADPVFGARGRYDFNEHWFGTMLADAGGFGGSSDSSWQAFGSVGYQFNERWSMQGGWRYLAVQKEIDGRDVEVDLNGPLLGFTVRF